MGDIRTSIVDLTATVAPVPQMSDNVDTMRVTLDALSALVTQLVARLGP